MKFLLSLLFVLSISGCVIRESEFAESDCFEFQDEYGVRTICDEPHYVVNNQVIYWDSTINVWVGPHGYWHHDVWVHGYPPGYRHHGHPQREHHEHHHPHPSHSHHR